MLLTDLINCVSRLWNPPVTNQKTERPILTVPVHRQINNQQGEAPIALAKAAAQIAGSGLVWKWIATNGKSHLCRWNSTERVFLRGELNDWIYFFGSNWRVRDTNNIEYLGFELPPGRRNIVGDLDTMTLFTEGDFEQFTNGTLVIHHENVHRVLA